MFSSGLYPLQRHRLVLTGPSRLQPGLGRACTFGWWQWVSTAESCPLGSLANFILLSKSFPLCLKSSHGGILPSKPSPKGVPLGEGVQGKNGFPPSPVPQLYLPTVLLSAMVACHWVTKDVTTDEPYEVTEQRDCA